MKKISLMLMLVLSGMMVQAEALPGLFWGNISDSWQKVLAGTVAGKRSKSKTPEIPSFPETRVLVMAHLGKYYGEKYTPEQVEQLRNFAAQGGVVVMYSAVPSMLFAAKPFDLTPGEAVLGAGAYIYGKPKTEVTETGKKIFGAEAVNPYETMGRRPGLGKPRGITVIFGNAKAVDTGVHRIGKGAFIYFSAAPKAGTPYGDMVKKLVQIATDEKTLNEFFPLPENNKGAMVNGEIKHLAVAGVGAPASFLTEKLSAMLKKKN